MSFTQYLKESDSINVPILKQSESKRKQIYKKYMVQGNSFSPVGEIVTEKVLPAGIYRIQNSMEGIFFEIHDVNTDDILKFEDNRYNSILKEIDNFWNLKEDFTKYGFTHKRGILLYGDPGVGKSVMLKLAMAEAAEKNNIVLITKDAHNLVSGLRALREVEKERKVLCIIEDIDEIINYGGEHAILELFDGDSQTDNVLFLATTNYIQKLPPRILRASRFDRKIKIDNPPTEGRYAYLKAKLKENIDDAKIHELAEKTKGLSFAQLREFVISTFCLKHDADKVIDRLKNHLESNLSEGDEFKRFLGSKMLDEGLKL